MTKAGKYISYRPIGVEEVPVLAAMHRQIWQEAYAAIFPEEKLLELRHKDFMASWQERILEGCWNLYWVCHAAEKAGFVVYGGHDDKKVEIKSFYFLPAYRAKGITDAAMHELLQRIKMDGGREVFLWVLEGNKRAQQFYHRHGFLPAFKTQSRERFGFELKEVQMRQDL